ncbi:MAG: rfaE1 [Solimicrobium sp.]|jgi:rfaE bifunctional protein kinase chain/domain|nr:rfaE1 [Solimicrobium sp.]
MTQLNLTGSKVLVVGDVMLDQYVFGEVDRISPEAPVPIVRVNHREERLGGAANVARNVVELGISTSLIGVVGEDEAGSKVENLLRESKINSYLKHDHSISTIIKLRVIGRQQQLLRVDFEERPNEGVLRNKLSQFLTLLPDYQVVILSDYAKGALANVREMIAHGIELKKTILVDPKGLDFDRYSGASILTPNKSELCKVIGEWKSESDLTEKSQNLRRHLKLKALLVTRSEEGISLYTEDFVHHVPTRAREVFDVSGAGDTVIATLGAMLASGKNLIDAVEIANRAGGIVVGKLGTATVTYPELFPT